MKNTILRSTRPLLIAALVASACNAMAAQRVDLASVNLNAPALTAKNVFTLTGLAPEELSVQYVEKLGGKNVSRFQQFYKGIPILGESIVIKVVGDPQQSAPSLMSGTILRNLAQDLPSIKPAIDEKTVLGLAKTQSRTQSTSAEKVNLYIRQGANGAAHLVYMVSFKNDSAASASRPSYLIDATSGAVLDSWDGQEERRKFGPGDSYKKAFEALAQMPGWDAAKASKVIGYARDVYWTEGRKMNQGACGAEKAAADLGLKVADVTAAFNLAATCHGDAAVDSFLVGEAVSPANVDYGNIVRVSKEAPKSSSGSGERLRQSAKTGALNKTGSWFKVEGNVNSLGQHGSLDWAQNRFTFLMKSPNRPVGVCFGSFFLHLDGATNPCTHKDWGSTEQAKMRYAGKGTYTNSQVHTNWTPVHGYRSVVTKNTTGKTMYIPRELTYSQIKTSSTSWSVETTAGIKLTQKFSVPLVSETSAELSLTVGTTDSGAKSLTITEYYYSPAVTLKPGQSVRLTLKERWIPVKTIWSVPVEFGGWVGADYGFKYNGANFWALPASNYFYEYGTDTGSEKAKITVMERASHDITIAADLFWE
jgi:hypothetical protein